MASIKRRRGNTYADEITVTSEPVEPATVGLPVNVTGYTFEMHVTKDQAPDERTAANLLYTLTGTILDAPNGRVEFVPTLLQATQPDGDYFYEIVMTDGALRTRTISMGTYTYY